MLRPDHRAHPSSTAALRPKAGDRGPLGPSAASPSWWARSPAVTGSDFIHTVTWLRLVPDLVFDVGVAALVVFVVRAIVMDIRLRRAGGQ